MIIELVHKIMYRDDPADIIVYSSNNTYIINNLECEMSTMADE